LIGAGQRVELSVVFEIFLGHFVAVCNQANVVQLVGIHESAYLEHCKQYALKTG
jgi:hypothetical protein